MANANSAFGLKPVGTKGGYPWNGQVIRCYCSTELYVGDPVIQSGTADTSGECPVVVTAVGGKTNKVFGVIVAFEPNRDNLSQVYNPNTQARYCLVAPADANTIFEIQAGATVIPKESVGLNAELKSGAGSTVTGLSGWYMDSGDTTAPDADATGQLTIMGFVNRPDNDITSAYGKWLVCINLPQVFPGIVGV